MKDIDKVNCKDEGIGNRAMAMALATALATAHGHGDGDGDSVGNN